MTQPKASAAASVDEAEVPADALPRSRSTGPARSVARGGERSPTAARGDTRVVQVLIAGASGGRLSIDGIEQPWFGVRHELTLGKHRFEVLPPNETCCVTPQPKTVEIVQGPAEQKVVLTIEFREATLFAQAPAGATLICGELFPGALPLPGKRTVRVTKAETKARCTLLPPAGSTERPKTVDVVLRPGDTFTLSG